jgi:hypothetical protein
VTTSVPPRIVPLTKLSEYLLNPEHRAGGPKSVFFRAFGFSGDRLDVMIAALIAHPDLNPVEQVRTDQWGTRYVARCNVESPDGRNPCILTVWIVPPGQVDATLVTAYPAD